MDLGQHDVGRAVSEKAAAFDGRKLERVAQDQDRLAEREKVARQLRVDDRTFVDHDEPRLGGRPIGVKGEGWRAFGTLARPVNERVDGRRARAALRSHHQGGFAGEGGERGLAARALGDVARQRRLADARVAEETKHLRLALFEPSADLVDRLGLLARPLAGDRSRKRGAGYGGLLRPGWRGRLRFSWFARAFRLAAHT